MDDEKPLRLLVSWRTTTANVVVHSNSRGTFRKRALDVRPWTLELLALLKDLAIWSLQELDPKAGSMFLLINVNHLPLLEMEKKV